MTNFRQFLTRERAILMGCIGLALGFWVLNRLSTKFRKTMPVRIEYFTPTGKALRTMPPQSASVSWQGTGWDLLTGSDPHIDLTVENDSIQTFYLRSNASQQLGNDVISVSPEQITVEIEDIATKTVNIQAVALLSFAKGFDLADSIEISPSTVSIQGAKSVLEAIDYVKTDTLRFEKLNNSVSTNIILADNPILTFGQKKVKARLSIEQFTGKNLVCSLTC